MDVLLVGYGNIGQKLYEEYNALNMDIYDPMKGIDEKKSVVYDLAFITVDTPLSNEEECDLSQVRTAVFETEAKMLVLKSTVPPGTTENLCREFGKRIVHSPEFYGMTQHSDSSKIDFNFTILGYVDGRKEDACKVIQVLQRVYNGSHKFHMVDSKVSELAKYMENALLASKVSLCVQFYDIAKQLGINYEEVRETVLLDERISRYHTFVYEDKPYWESHCFDKDLRAICSCSKAALLEFIICYNDYCKAKHEGK